MSRGDRPRFFEARSADAADGDRLRLSPRDPAHQRRDNAVAFSQEPRPEPHVDKGGNALALDPEKGRPPRKPRGHVSMAKKPGRGDDAAPLDATEGDVLRLEASDAPVARKKDRAVAFASLPNKPTLKKRARPRRQRAKPRLAELQRATGRALRDAFDGLNVKL